MDAADGSVASSPPIYRDEVMAWIRESAHVIAAVDPSAPLDDLEPLRAWIGGATVVGLGESVRGVRSGRQLYLLKHRLTRLLVDTLGFRMVALEDTPAVGARLDDHVRSGTGELDDLLASAWGPWQTEEFLQAVRWLRSRNAAHPDDPVRIVGVDGSEPNALARNTLNAQAETGHRVVYWGGMGHIAVDGGTDSPTGGVSDGWVLRENLGPGYLAVGMTCHHGVGAEVLPPPPDHFAESILGTVGIERYALDLRTDPASSAVRSWLTMPTTTRIIGPRYDPGHDADFAMTGALGGWFDLLVHVRDITPARYLTA